MSAVSEKKRTRIVERIAYFLISIVLLGYLMRMGAAFIIPVLFGVLFSFLLVSTSARFERFFRNRIIGIIMTLVMVLLSIAGVITLISFQFADIINDLSSLGTKIRLGLNNLFDLLTQYGISESTWSKWIENNTGTLLEAPFSFFASSLSTSTTALASLFLALLYTFFFLLYRRAFKLFIVYQFRPEARDRVEVLMNDIRKLMQQYLKGLGTVIIILAVLNSLGLYLIGIDYPMFWGILASFLVIIPYVGTTLGGLLPFLYTLATADSYWQPLAVVVFYFSIQQIEGNIITPRIVGSSVRINPLVSIMALILFGMIWGIPGIILCIPLVAMIKVFMEQVDVLKPFSFMLSTEIYDPKDTFEQEFNEPRYSLLQYFFSNGGTKKNQKEESNE